jgi:hypothetical protein
MERECLKTVFVTPKFLGSLCELLEHNGREVLHALLHFMASPGVEGLRAEPLNGAADGICSVRAGDSCRILFSDAGVVKLLFAGTEEAVRRFAANLRSDATAFAEAPVAFQLHIDFWQSVPTARFETPSCGAPASAADLAGLILDGREFLPLAHLLLSRGQEVASLVLKLREIETALGEPLPGPARSDPAWWANDRTNAQANSWLAIGWRAALFDLQKEAVTFSRIVSNNR